MGGGVLVILNSWSRRVELEQTTNNGTATRLQGEIQTMGHEFDEDA